MKTKENGLMSRQKQMNTETMKCIWKGEDLLFTFKDEAEFFALNNDLKLEYEDGGLTDNEHYKVKGYKSKLYWIAK